MTDVHVHQSDLDLDEPILIEGLPGIGLAGKIVTDHLLEEHPFEHYASVHCETLPQLSVYHEGDRQVRAPLRIYADPEGTHLILSSDIPVRLDGKMTFIDCLTGWFQANDIFPIFLSGRPATSDERSIFGIGSGRGIDRLDAIDLPLPNEPGAISGPTGGLLHRCAELDLDAVGLVVDSDVQFPDPEAARLLIEAGVDPLTALETDVSSLLDHAEDIREQREALAESMRQAGQESSSQAQPLRMFQ